jgi:glucose/arabinose dehydrogenase/PKD repeat protein
MVPTRTDPVGHPAQPGPWRLCLLVAVVMSAALLSPPGVARAAPALPPGFALRALPSGQSELPTDIAFAPDGSYFTTGKNGRVAWVAADGREATLADLPVVTVGDLGLTGVAVATDYDESRTVYTVRTLDVDGAWTMRLSAWTVVGSPDPTGIDAERVLWDLPAGSDAHAMTDVVAAPDGTLWVSTGDSADFRLVDPQALRALDLEGGYGKLLHVTPEGAGVPTNPFYDPAAPSSWKSRVYASGFRSPFRFSLDPATGGPVVGDVGWATWEEVDVALPGASYGWPCWEGSVPTPGYADLAACSGVPNTDPLWTYPHGPQGSSVSGGIVYTGSLYPPEYQGAYFFGDYAAGRLYTLRYDGRGQLVRPPEPDGFGSDVGGPVAFASAPNGDVVYVDIRGNRVLQLVHTPGNRAPSARAAATGDPATRTVAFDGGGSGDPDADPLTYAWDFGDGGTGEGAVVEHQYAEPGTSAVTATLTVTDPLGAQGTTELVVVPAEGIPVLELTGPSAEDRFAVGDPVRATATARDAEDGPLDVTWSVVLVHCSGGYCHDHPGESFSGPAFERAFQDHGDDTRMEVTASAADSAGVRNRATFVARPQLRTLVVTSSVPSPITVNGVARTSAELTVGARVSVIAPDVASDGRSTFVGWSDGSPRELELVMPDADLTLGATYTTAGGPATSPSPGSEP